MLARSSGMGPLHAWGMTEMSPLGSVAHPRQRSVGEDAWRYRVSQGQLAPHVQARLIEESGAVAPHDGANLGKLQVRGPWITGSYYVPDGEPVDADKFHDGWLRTGDVGNVTPDRYLTLVDRSKDVIKSGGGWISSVTSRTP